MKNLLSEEINNLIYKVDKILLGIKERSPKATSLLWRQAKAYGDVIKVKYEDAEVSKVVNEILKLENTK